MCLKLIQRVLLLNFPYEQHPTAQTSEWNAMKFSLYTNTRDDSENFEFLNSEKKKNLFQTFHQRAPYPEEH